MDEVFSSISVLVVVTFGALVFAALQDDLLMGTGVHIIREKLKSVMVQMESLRSSLGGDLGLWVGLPKNVNTPEGYNCDYGALLPFFFFSAVSFDIFVCSGLLED
jgi:hypothetical protein